MTIQLNTTLRNNMIGQYESSVGASPILRTYTGAQPADCAAAASGTLLGQGALPADWMNAPAAGAITKLGAWTVTGQAGAGAGTAQGHYRLWDSAGTTCMEQGSITATGGGGDMTFDNVSIANAQVATVTSWTRTQGGA